MDDVPVGILKLGNRLTIWLKRKFFSFQDGELFESLVFWESQVCFLQSSDSCRSLIENMVPLQSPTFDGQSSLSPFFTCQFGGPIFKAIWSLVDQNWLQSLPELVDLQTQAQAWWKINPPWKLGDGVPMVSYGYVYMSIIYIYIVHIYMYIYI